VDLFDRLNGKKNLEKSAKELPSYSILLERKAPIQNKEQPKGKIHAVVQLLWGLTTPPLQLLLKEQPKVQLKSSKPERVVLGGTVLSYWHNDP